MSEVKHLSATSVPRLSGATIRRKFFGGTEEQPFEDFVRSTVQDEQVAFNIAYKMLAGDDPYIYGAEEPEFYEEFEVIDREGLLWQMNRYAAETE